MKFNFYNKSLEMFYKPLRRKNIPSNSEEYKRNQFELLEEELNRLDNRNLYHKEYLKRYIYDNFTIELFPNDLRDEHYYDIHHFACMYLGKIDMTDFEIVKKAAEVMLVEEFSSYIDEIKKSHLTIQEVIYHINERYIENMTKEEAAISF